MRARDDEGSVLLLTVGLFAVLLLLVAVVVDASAVVLAQRSLSDSADGAAVEAAQQLDQAAFYATGVADGVPLSPPAVEATVADAAAAASTDQPGLAMSATVEGGHVAVVRAERTVTVPFGGWLGVGSVHLSATARSRSPLVP